MITFKRSPMAENNKPRPLSAIGIQRPPIEKNNRPRPSSAAVKASAADEYRWPTMAEADYFLKSAAENKNEADLGRFATLLEIFHSCPSNINKIIILDTM